MIHKQLLMASSVCRAAEFLEVDLLLKEAFPEKNSHYVLKLRYKKCVNNSESNIIINSRTSDCELKGNSLLRNSS